MNAFNKQSETVTVYLEITLRARKTLTDVNLALKESTKALFIVAHYFHHHGYTIRINGQKCSPTASNHEKYADDGDLFIQTKEKWVRIEVKGLPYKY